MKSRFFTTLPFKRNILCTQYFLKPYAQAAIWYSVQIDKVLTCGWKLNLMTDILQRLHTFLDEIAEVVQNVM